MIARIRIGIALLLFAIVAGVTGTGLTQEAHAKNYRGPFQGRVVDTDTRAPIEGAVVFVEWHIRHMGAGDTFYDSAEVLTDANGAFSISSKWSWNPWTNIVMDSSFIIFKGGYGSVRTHWTTLHETAQFLEHLAPERRMGDPMLYYKIDFEDDVPVFLLKRLTTPAERWKNMSGLEPASDVPEGKYSVLTEEIKREETSLRTRISDE